MRPAYYRYIQTIERTETIVNRSRLSRVLIVLSWACLAALSLPLPAQDKPADMTKLLAEIAGDYEFALPGRSVVVKFTERDGKLYGAPDGETEELISPVQGKPLCFDLTVGDSADYYVLQFVRNGQGVIDKCVMTAFGTTFEGTKIVR